MRCPRCEQETPSDAKFCPDCGSKLVVICASCCTSNVPTHRFCKRCGEPLTAPRTGGIRSGTSGQIPKRLAEKILTFRSALEGERKQVTVLFADMKGSL